MSRFIYIGKEGFRVESEEHFGRILEEKLGRDAAELFKEYLNRYHYAIEEALDALDSVDGASIEDECDLSAAKDALERVMW